MAAVAAAFMATSCDNWTPPTDSSGSVALNTLSVTNDDAEKIVSGTAGRSETSLSDYAVKIYKAGDNSNAVAEYTYGSMPEIVTLAAGDYRIDVESHQVQKAEWDHPYFKGSSSNFTVEAAKITPVGEIVAEFASVRVTVKYTDELRAVMGDDVTVTVKANDEGELVFTPDETRSGYFEYVENSTTMVVTLNGTIGGVNGKEQFTFTDLAPRQHRIVTLDVQEGPMPPEQTGTVNPGGIHVSAGVDVVDIDGKVVVEEEPVGGAERPWKPDQGEEPDPGPGPDQPVQPEAIDFKSDYLDIKGGYNNPSDFDMDAGGKPAIVNILSTKGIKNLQVTIKSELLEPALPTVGLTSSFNLAHPETPELESALRDDLGLKVSEDVVDKNEVEFNISGMVPLLAGFPCEHIFVLEVEDNDGNIKSLELKFKS